MKTLLSSPDEVYLWKLLSNPKHLLRKQDKIPRYNMDIQYRGGGTYLNILGTSQVCLKFGVDKIQK